MSSKGGEHEAGAVTEGMSGVTLPAPSDRLAPDPDMTLPAVGLAPGSLPTVDGDPAGRRLEVGSLATVAAPNEGAGADVPSSDGLRSRGDRYEFRDEIDRGGIGRIRVAFDRRLERKVAVKELLRPAPGSAHDARFVREARITAELEHPSIIPVSDLGRRADGVPFFCMKLVDGKSLATFVEAAQTLDERVALLRHVVDVADAVAYAHARGVVHRDLKPGNVLVGAFGEAVVIDWGLAKHVAAAPEPAIDAGDGVDPTSGVETMDDPQLTGAGGVMGTLAYMPPEQARGEPVDERADVFAIGAMLYHVLTGTLPFSADTMPELLRQVIEDAPEDIAALEPSLPADLVAIVHKAMARDPAARYPDASALARDLHRFQTGRLVSAHQYSFREVLRLWLRRYWRSVVVGVIGLLALLALAVASYVRIRVERDRAEAARQDAELARGIAEGQLEEILGLSDLHRVAQLRRRADTLWPARPERIADFQAWLDGADRLVARIDQHRAVLSRLRGSGSVDAQGRHRFSTPSAQWRHDTLAQLIEELEDLRDVRVPDVSARLDFASTVRQRSIVDAADAWVTLDEALAEGGTGVPGYEGLSVAPVLGMVPLGPDPDTGLWEFVHLQTGEVPTRDADGALSLGPEHGLVFVLLPAGDYVMGAQADDPSAANFDPAAGDDEGPPREVSVDAFLVAKHEMTLAQWTRVTGEVAPTGASPTMPMSSIRADDAREVMRQLDLRLPTEAEWEYAARAGTTSVWWPGDEVADLAETCNIADRHARDHGAPGSWHTEDFDDGHFKWAPIGSYRPNAFGLFDVIGNVAEWTAPHPEEWRPVGDYHVSRGAGWDATAANARIAYRGNQSPGLSTLGVRPARSLSPAGESSTRSSAPVR